MLLCKMKSLRNSFDVFEFKEEDELTIAANEFSSKYNFIRPHPVARETEIDSKEIDHVPAVDNDATYIDHSCDNQEMTGDEPVGMTSVAISKEGSLSPVIAEDDASNDGSSSNNCFSGCDVDNGRDEVVFFPHYVDYHGVHYLDTAVTFSTSFIEVKTKTPHENQGKLDIQLEIEDIVKIESLWSARHETGTINICFISKGGVQNDTLHSTEIEGLKFSTVDSDWYEKQHAIKSLDVRYKALWSVLLDIGMEECAEASPDKKARPLSRICLPDFGTPFEEIIYPKGDPDAVSIRKRDVDLLRPDTFLNDTIIDFYIKYLKNKLKPEESLRFHFFNSFFFQKMAAHIPKDPSSAFDGDAAFRRVCKWTRKLNLLEKDFILIPVNYNYHWSVIVICYFGEVAKYEDTNESVRVPCILHMDSIRGSHAGLDDLMRSYLWEEWKERKKEACEDLHAKFRNLKYVSLELPQQKNSYDCGLFLLHYVELFLKEVPVNFSIYNTTSSSKFLKADWFPPVEASLKRAHIKRLIYDLLENHLEGTSPSCGNYKNSSSTIAETTNDSGNPFEFLSRITSLFKSLSGSSFCSQPREGFKTTSSLRNAQCASYSKLGLEEFPERGSALEPFVNPEHLALEQGDSFEKFKRCIEEEVEASMDVAAYQHTIPEPCVFTDFEMEPEEVVKECYNDMPPAEQMQYAVHKYDACDHITTFQKKFYDQDSSNECLNVHCDPVFGEVVELSDSESSTPMHEVDNNADLHERSPELYHCSHMQEDGIKSVPERNCPKRLRLTTSLCKERI